MPKYQEPEEQPRQEPLQIFIFQEALKIDYQKFIDELVIANPKTLGSLKPKLEMYGNIPVIKSEKGDTMFTFQIDGNGNATAMIALFQFTNETEKNAFDEIFKKALRNSVIGSEEQLIVQKTTYENLSNEEKILYKHYEKLRDYYEPKIEEARKTGKPILSFIGEDHSLHTSKALKHFAIDISAENGFETLNTEIFAYKDKSYEPFYNSDKAPVFYNLKIMPTYETFYTAKFFADRSDKMIPDVHPNDIKVHAIDIPEDDPAVTKDWKDELFSMKTFRRRNKVMVNNTLDKSSGDVVDCNGATHMMGIIEHHDILAKYTVIPLNLTTTTYKYVTNDYDFSKTRRDRKHMDYMNCNLPNEEYSSGKPYTDLMSRDETDEISKKETNEIDRLLKDKTHYDIALISRKFSKIYDDRHGGQMHKLEEMLNNAMIDKSSPDKIDREELGRISDHIYILQKEFGKAVSMKEEGNKLILDLASIKKELTIQR